MKCFEHKKPVKMVSGWVKKGLGTKVLKTVCPVCYNLEHRKFVCKKCGAKNDYWTQEDLFPYRCKNCRDTGKPYIPSSFIVKRIGIPSWRLDLDDASPADIITKPLEEFGVPLMSESRWKEFYSQEHELKKQRQMKKAIQEVVEEGIEEAAREVEMEKNLSD
ncbi:MAG: hypothetical protein D6822_01685 [Cyanobacteria bacterium J149]|nr:MAG: hypothetical protein D6822_01685 [Cyanobacteria bacterium J149]